MTGRLPSLGLLTLAVAACSSTGGTDSTDPIVIGGQVEPQRNLIISDLNYGSPNNSVAVDEIFDLTVSMLALVPDGTPTDPGEGPPGALRTTLAQEGFGAGNTMRFEAGINRFTFDINTDAGAFDEVFFNLTFADPVERPDVPNYRFGVMYGSDPDDFDDIFAAFGVPAPTPGGTPVGYANFLTALEDTEFPTPEEQEAAAELAEALQTRTEYLIGPDQHVFRYSLGDGRLGSLWTTNMNNADDSRRTDAVGIASFYETYDNGDERYAHWVFGHRTPEPEVPISGSASYQGKVVGTVLTNNTVQSLTGSSFLDVDFASGTMDLQLGTVLRRGGGQDGTTTFFDYKTVAGRGFIDGSTFEGTLAEVLPNGDNGTAPGDATGDFSGGFFGPVANEAGGIFKFGDGDSLAHGAFTARQPRVNDGVD